MRFSAWSLWAVVLMASVAVAAQESNEKQPAAPSNESSDENAKADAADEKPDAPADETPAKKSPKKGPTLKLGKSDDKAGKSDDKAGKSDDAKVLKTLSYMQGFMMGQQIYQQFTQQGVEMDDEIFFAALKDAMAGKDPTMSEEEMKNAVPAIQKYVSEKYAVKAKEQAVKNKEEGAAFLAANKKKEGVKTLPSGLQYKVIESGRGETPKKTDTIKMHYKGSFAASGKEFESSYKSGTPATVPITNLVRGMAEGLQLMKVGSKWQIFVPSELAYGEQGNRGIPPNATLVFEVELISIEKGGRSPLAPPTLK